MYLLYSLLLVQVHYRGGVWSTKQFLRLLVKWLIFVVVAVVVGGGVALPKLKTIGVTRYMQMYTDKCVSKHGA